MQHNPYAPPQARVSAHVSDGSDVWREGELAVLTPSGELPPRCVKCNADAEQPIKERKVYWHTPWLYLLILISLLIYLFVVLIARKRARISPGLCSEHRQRRNQYLIGSWLVILTGIGLFFIAFSRSSAAAGLLGAVLLLGGIIVGMLKARIVYAVRIDTSRIALKGCGEAFLASLSPRR
jgi:hypothetical protein